MSIEEQIAEAVRKVDREEMSPVFSARDLELLTADDVASLLKYSDRHSVYKLKRERKLKAVILGDKTIRFRASDVRRFIEEREE